MVNIIKGSNNFDMLISNLTYLYLNKNKTYKLYIYVENCNKEEMENLLDELKSRGYRWMLKYYNSNIKYIIIINGLKELGYETESCTFKYMDDNVYKIDYKFLTFDFEDNNESKINSVVSDIEKISEKNIIYISGAITGTDDYIERFENAEKELKDKGYEVINPAKFNSYLPNTTTWEQYMEIDYKLLDICDTIYMLNGWENSKGANAELDYAKQNNKMVVYQSDNENVLKLGNSLTMYKYNDDTINVKFLEFNLVLTKYDIEKIREFLK